MCARARESSRRIYTYNIGTLHLAPLRSTRRATKRTGFIVTYLHGAKNEEKTPYLMPSNESGAGLPGQNAVIGRFIRSFNCVIWLFNCVIWRPAQ